MKTDLYTKFILTVIAIALVAIVARDITFVSSLSAHSANSDVPGIDELQKKKKMLIPTAVKETDSSTKDDKKDNRKIIDVNIVQINGKDVGYKPDEGQFPVYLTNKHVPVYFKGIPYVKVSNYYDFQEGAVPPAKEPKQIIED